MDGHLAALAKVFGVGEDLRHDVVEGEPAPHDDTDLAILRPDHVVKVQGRGRPVVRGFFAVVGHVKGYPPLPLRIVEDVVHDLLLYHHFVYIQQHVVRQRCRRFACLDLRFGYL